MDPLVDNDHFMSLLNLYSFTVFEQTYSEI